MTTAPWRDPALPAAARVDDLLSRMTLQEKTAQLTLDSDSEASNS